MSAHKTDRDRKRRNAPTFTWTHLPAEGRTARAPAMPPLPSAWGGSSGKWSAPTRSYWNWLWATPQATQWDQSGTSLHAAAILYEAMRREPLKAHNFNAELRQIEDRHGLSPKALLALRWKIGPTVPTTRVVEPAGVVSAIGGGAMPSMSGKGSGVKAWREWAVACGADAGVVAEWDKARLVAEFGGAAPPERRAGQPSALDRIKR